MSTLNPENSVEALWAADIVGAEWTIQRLTIAQSELLGSRRAGQRPPASTALEDSHVILVEAYEERSVGLERITRMIALAEERRNRARRELERYRERQASRSRNEIIDAEFVETKRDS
jgi:hypothetical protein